MPDWLTADFFWSWFGRLADFGSLIAAGVSIWAVRKVAEIRRHFLLGARIEPLVFEIKKTLEALEDFNSEYPDRRVQIEATIRACLARLRRQQTELPLDVREAIRELNDLEMRLDAPHTDGEPHGDSSRKLIVEDLIIKIQVVQALMDETRLSRQIGGENA